MTAIFFRTLLIYLILSIILRCMGKRQVGELEMSDLVITLLLSEVATLPIADSNMPLLNGIFPVLLLLSLEIITTFLKNKLPFLKKMVESRPSILIDRGRLNQEELGRMRISIEEFLGECRLLGYGDLRDIDYAILEQDGKLSIIPRPEKQPVCIEDLGLAVKRHGLSHPLILDGHINDNHLKATGRDRAWLDKECARRGMRWKDIFYMAIDDAGEILLIPREKKG